MDKAIEWLLGLPLADMARADSWRLGFVAEYNNYVKVALVLAFLALAYLTVRSYRREGDAPTGAKATLMALRIATLLLIFAVVFNPAIVLRFVKTLRSTVVLLLDNSRSMSFQDRYGGPGDGAELAAFLGVDKTELSGLSRLEIARRSLVRPGGAMEKLAADHPLLLIQFSTARPGQEAYTRKLVEIPHQAGAADRALGQIAVALDALAGDGYETNIPLALRHMLERTPGRRITAILVSDGQITAEGASGRLAAAVEYASQRVGGPVSLYAVAVGDPTPPRNVTVTGMEGPREIRRKAEAQLSVVLSHRHMAGRTVTLRLFRRRADQKGQEWVDLGIRQAVKLEGSASAPAAGGPGSGQRQVAILRFTSDEIGRFVYKVTVAPTPDEFNTKDNWAETTVEVSDEKTNVLLVSGDGGWEFQYFKTYLLCSPDLFRVSVWQQNADAEINQAASTGMRLSRLPRELEELIGSPAGKPHPGYDVVVLCDPQPTQEGFDGHFVEILKTFVAKHGGGLCFVAGNKYSELLLLAGDTYRPLGDLLPVVLGPNAIDLAVRIGQRRPEPATFVLTTDGVDHPVMKLGASAQQTREIWGMEGGSGLLPGVYWAHPVAKIKPAAKVLARHSNPLRRTARNEPEPLVAVQPVGAGRTIYIGSDETWRWRYVDDGYYHRRFWANVMRYLATLKARQVVITAGGDRFLVGQKIVIEAEVYDEKYQPRKDLTFEVVLRKEGEKTGGQTIVLKAVDVERKPGQYKGSIVAKHTGAYELTALVGDPLAAEKVASKHIVVELPQAEYRRTEADLAAMRRVASRDENFLRIHQVDRLPRLIPPDELKTVDEQPHYLWDTPTMLLLVLSLLVAEWILRKKYNMA